MFHPFIEMLVFSDSEEYLVPERNGHISKILVAILQMLQSDNAPPPLPPQFRSHEFSQFLRELNWYYHKPSSPLWAPTKPLVKAVRSAHCDNKDWKREIFKFPAQLFTKTFIFP